MSNPNVFMPETLCQPQLTRCLHTQSIFKNPTNKGVGIHGVGGKFLQLSIVMDVTDKLFKM